MSESNSQPDGPGGRESSSGRFAPGNKAGRGNPHAAAVQKLRSALYKAVTPKDLAEVVGVLLSKAKAGDIAAVRELIHRLLGPPVAADILERLEQVEQRLARAEVAWVAWAKRGGGRA